MIGKVKTVDGKWAWSLTGEKTFSTLDGKTIELTSGDYEIMAESDNRSMGEFQTIKF